MSRYGYYDYFQPSRPKEAKGGIKAQSQKGAFGKSWWAQRWIAVLESFNIGARLSRGKSYARKGQVLSVDIDKGIVKAKVQGSRSKPYNITITVKALTSKEWEKLAEEVSHQALFAAKLLAGEMPQDIEEAFKKVKLSLFPEKMKDLETDCSCPDWSNPCKHIAAVYYLLGEEFDRDPFLIFRLRGMNREEMIELLSHDLQSQQKEKKPGQFSPTGEVSLIAQQQKEIPPEPLQSDIPLFWTGGVLPDGLFGEVKTPPLTAALPRRLGNFPFWRGEQKFLESLETLYKKGSSHGLEIFLGSSGDGS
jgi:uncharacterized Zn finger protein